MRDKLIHDYLDVDYEIVWDVMINKATDLRGHLMDIIAKESS